MSRWRVQRLARTDPVSSEISSFWQWVVRKAPRTACYFIQSAMTGFIGDGFLSRNRVSLKEAFEGLELCERKLSCTVLRGLDGSNPVRLLGKRELIGLANTSPFSG